MFEATLFCEAFSGASEFLEGVLGENYVRFGKLAQGAHTGSHFCYLILLCREEDFFHSRVAATLLVIGIVGIVHKHFHKRKNKKTEEGES